MEYDSLIQRFGEVEHAIDHLLGVYEALKKENSELSERNERLEQALREQTEAVKRYAQERDLVRSKIDGLLTDWVSSPKTH